MPFDVEKLEWCVYPMVKNFDDMYICFDITHERDRQLNTQTDRQTDRQTPHDSIGRAYV